MIILLIAAVLLLGLSGAAVVAQSGEGYSLSWFTVDGGGGTSSGGSYSLSGTIGQPDAGVLGGGDYTLAGGFWSGGALQGDSGPTGVFLPVVIN
jgi:hypothetical protein